MRTRVVLWVVASALLANGCGGTDGDEPDKDAIYTIQYVIEGSGTLANLTYSTDGKSGTKTLRDIELPWKMTVKANHDEAPFTFSIKGSFANGPYQYSDTIMVDGSSLVQGAGSGDGGSGTLENSLHIDR